MQKRTYTVTSPSGRSYEIDWNKDTEPTESDFNRLKSQIEEQEKKEKISSSLSKTPGLLSKIHGLTKSILTADEKANKVAASIGVGYRNIEEMAKPGGQLDSPFTRDLQAEFSGKAPTISDTYEKLFTAPEFITKRTSALADKIRNFDLGKFGQLSMPLSSTGLGFSNLPITMNQIKDMPVAGAVEFVGEMLSPGNIGFGLSGLARGAGLKLLQKGLESGKNLYNLGAATQIGLSFPLAVEGGRRAFTSDNLLDTAVGTAEMLMGTTGFLKTPFFRRFLSTADDFAATPKTPKTSLPELPAPPAPPKVSTALVPYTPPPTSNIPPVSIGNVLTPSPVKNYALAKDTPEVPAPATENKFIEPEPLPELVFARDRETTGELPIQPNLERGEYYDIDSGIVHDKQGKFIRRIPESDVLKYKENARLQQELKSKLQVDEGPKEIKKTYGGRPIKFESPVDMLTYGLDIQLADKAEIAKVAEQTGMTPEQVVERAKEVRARVKEAAESSRRGEILLKRFHPPKTPLNQGLVDIPEPPSPVSKSETPQETIPKPEPAQKPELEPFEPATESITQPTLKSKKVPPSRRLFINRGKHDRVSVAFPTDFEKTIFQVLKAAKGFNYKPLRRLSDSVATRFGIKPHEASALLRSYRQHVIDLAKQQPKEGIDLRIAAPSFDTFIKGEKGPIESPSEMAIGESEPLNPELSPEEQVRLMQVAAASHKGKEHREALQNATDAAFEGGRAGNVEIKVDTIDNSVTFRDDGPGLDKEGLKTVYIKPFSSGKEGRKTAGKFGIGKSSYLYSTKRFEVTSRTIENGKLKEYHFEGTADDLFNKKVLIHEVEPTGTDTGLTLKYWPDNNVPSGRIIKHVNSLMHPRGRVKVYKDDELIHNVDLEEINKNRTRTTFKTDDFGLTVIIDKDPTLTTPSNPYADVIVSINGMPHPEADRWLEVPYIPKNIYVDIEPYFEPTDSRYPVNQDRTALKPKASNEIDKILIDNIAKLGRNIQIKKLQDLWNDMSEIKPGFYLSNEEKFLSPEFEKLALTSPEVKTGAEAVEKVVKSIYSRLKSYQGKTGGVHENLDELIKRLPGLPAQTDRLGFRFSNPEKGRFGINLPNPNNTVLMENITDERLRLSTAGTHKNATYGIFLDLPLHFDFAKTPKQFGTNLLLTIIHELSHNVRRQEGGSQAIVIDLMLIEIVDDLDELIRTLTEGFYDKSGAIKSDFRALLEEARNNPGKEDDLEFTLTGIGTPEELKPSRPGVKKDDSSGIKPRKDEPRRITSSESGHIGFSIPKSPADKGGGGGPSKKNPIENTPRVQKLRAALQESVILNKEQARLYTEERRKRLAKVAQVERGGLEGFYEKLGKLKGEMPKVQITPLREKLTKEEMDALIDDIDASDLLPFQKIKASYGLSHLYEGSVPQPNQILLLGKVFGQGVVDDLGFLKIPNFSLSTKPGLLMDLWNIPKAYRSSGDLPQFRHAFWLMHRGEFWKSFGPSIRAAFDKGFFENQIRDIARHPLLPVMEEYGLKLMHISEAPELFDSPLAEKIWGIGRWAAGSGRAHVTALNHIRFNMAKNMMEEITNTQDWIDMVMSEGMSDDLEDTLHQMMKYINSASGRGNLGTLEKNMRQINAVLWSAALQKSRIDMLNPANYIGKSKKFKKEYWKSLASATAVSLTMAAILKHVFDVDVELRPWEPDFGKGVIGNTRVDLTGGAGKFIRYAYNMAEDIVGTLRGEKPEQYSGFDRTVDLGRGMLSPSAGYIADFIDRRGFSGERFEPGKEAAKLMLPLSWEDAYDLAESDPDKLPLIALSLVGFSVQEHRTRSGRRPAIQPFRRPSLSRDFEKSLDMANLKIKPFPKSYLN